MIINFTKMHCLGNDFVIINAIAQQVQLSFNQLKSIADRHIGVGCDQIILLEPPIQPNSDFYYKIYNADGQMAEQCVNGARCAAKLAFDEGLATKNNITADCLSGTISFVIENDASVTAELDVLTTKINRIPLELQAPNLTIKQDLYYLSIGNPHAVFFVDYASVHGNNSKTYNYNFIAENIAKLDVFPKGVNIGFASIVDHNIFLKVFERGCGETLSCGSNAIAAYLVAKNLRLVGNRSAILFKLGALNIRSCLDDKIAISGLVRSVFKGELVI